MTRLAQACLALAENGRNQRKAVVGSAAARNPGHARMAAPGQRSQCMTDPAFATLTEAFLYCRDMDAP